MLTIILLISPFRPSVEEQLADLTKLLHTAIHSDEEDSGFSEQVRAPGKLDPNVLDNLNALSADNYSKSPTKSRAYAPTALLEAKKREVEGPSDESYFRFDSHTYSKGKVSDQIIFNHGTAQ